MAPAVMFKLLKCAVGYHCLAFIKYLYLIIRCQLMVQLGQLGVKGLLSALGHCTVTV